MKRVALSLLFALTLSSCAHRNSMQNQESIVSIQSIDRNGLTETISSKERLKLYQGIDYLSPQPYQKILRVFSKNLQGKNSSKITSYHSNGQLWQYLEAVDGRAHGFYRDWFANGNLRLEASVIEGTADINEMAQASWVFDSVATVYTESGLLEAKIPYDKGLLQGVASYYYPSGALQRSVPYEKNAIHGDVIVYDLPGNMKEKMSYLHGKKEGISMGYFDGGGICYEELYHNDLLMEGSYYDKDHQLINQVKEGLGKQIIYDEDRVSSMVSIYEGSVEGRIEIFSKEGRIEKFYTTKAGKKNGEELIYFPQKSEKFALKPKISFFWQDDVLHGVVKTWYETGSVESQKEMCDNKKNGLSFAWYESGEMMLSEGYENDTLIKGSYYRKGQKNPVSTIEKGSGLATLFDKNGIFLKKIFYERGKPVIDSGE